MFINSGYESDPICDMVTPSSIVDSRQTTVAALVLFKYFNNNFSTKIPCNERFDRLFAIDWVPEASEITSLSTSVRTNIESSLKFNI